MFELTNKKTNVYSTNVFNDIWIVDTSLSLNKGYLTRRCVTYECADKNEKQMKIILLESNDCACVAYGWITPS